MSPSEQIRITQLSFVALGLAVVALTSRSWETITLAGSLLLLFLPPAPRR
jgi:hypothetical protein